MLLLVVEQPAPNLLSARYLKPDATTEPDDLRGKLAGARSYEPRRIAERVRRVLARPALAKGLGPAVPYGHRTTALAARTAAPALPAAP